MAVRKYHIILLYYESLFLLFPWKIISYISIMQQLHSTLTTRLPPMADTNFRSGGIYNLEELGELARRGRTQQGLTQQQAADYLNEKHHTETAQPQISAAERGDARYTSLIFRMIEAFTDYDVQPEALHRIHRKG